jgi:hypothetical protein
MPWKYSDGLSSFKPEDDGEKVDHPGKKKPGFERFSPWVTEGFRRGAGPQGRPLMRMIALLVIISGLAWGSSRPNGLKRALLGRDHARVVLPIGVNVDKPQPWTQENVRDTIAQVQPLGLLCLQGWEVLTTNAEGKIVVEVVLNAEGAQEAAIYDQSGPVPEGVAQCLAGALGSVAWPLPAQRQAVTFPLK